MAPYGILAVVGPAEVASCRHIDLDAVRTGRWFLRTLLVLPMRTRVARL